MKKLIFSLFTVIVCALLNLGYVQASSVTDPNVTQEDGKLFVKRAACLLNNGEVSEDKKYFMCSSGKYNGYLTLGPATKMASCNLEVGFTQKHVLPDLTVNDEEIFVAQAESALTVCTTQSANFKSLKATLQSAKKSCDQVAQTLHYRGTCYLKAADLGTFVLGR